MTAIDVLQKTFGENVKPVFSNGFDKDVSELIKYMNFVSYTDKGIKSTDFLNKSNYTNMSLKALNSTKKYSSTQKTHKLNITK